MTSRPNLSTTDTRPAKELPGFIQPARAAARDCRNLWVENAKAIGIVLVVYGHVARGAFGAGLIADAQRFRLIDSIIYTFHMPLFFFLSGLFFYASLCKRGIRRLIANKIDSLFYIYITWSLIQGCVEVTLNRWTNAHATFGQVFEMLWKPRAQFWFLYALLLICVLAAFLYTKIPRRMFGWITAVSMGAFLLRDHNSGIPQVFYILSYFCFFALGLQFNAWQWRVFMRRWQLLAPALAAFAIAEYLFHATLGLTYRSSGAPVLLVALLSIGCIVIVSMCLTDRQLSLLTVLGSSSLVIYLVHVIVASGSRVILAKFLGLSDVYIILTVGCLFGLILPVAFARAAPKLRLGFLLSISPHLSVERRVIADAAVTARLSEQPQRLERAR